jgi:L-lactate utilization protein LutB
VPSPAGSKAKGRRGENMAVAWLQRFFSAVERKRLKGNKDEGDLTGTADFCVEVKNAERWNLHKWIGELTAEMDNSGKHYGFLMARRNRGEWVFFVPERTMERFLEQDRLVRELS